MTRIGCIETRRFVSILSRIGCIETGRFVSILSRNGCIETARVACTKLWLRSGLRRVLSNFCKRLRSRRCDWFRPLPKGNSGRPLRSNSAGHHCEWKQEAPTHPKQSPSPATFMNVLGFSAHWFTNIHIECDRGQINASNQKQYYWF